MASQRVPTPTSFVLNTGLSSEGVLLISPGGSTNTVQITGKNFNSNTQFVVSDDRSSDSFSPPAKGTVTPDGTSLSGSFTAFGPTPGPAIVDPDDDNIHPIETLIDIDVTVTTIGIVNNVLSGSSVQETTPA